MTDIASLARLGAEPLARLGPWPLALAPGAAWRAWAQVRATRVAALALTPGAAHGLGRGPLYTEDALDAAEQGWKPYDRSGAVAVIGVSGLIVPQLGVVGWTGATGCAELRWQVATAVADEQVAALALVIDSGGGFIAGVDETAAAIRAARAIKPVAAIVEANAFSAAYWIASAADTISAPRTGGVGHIGVMVEHLDDSGWLEQMGFARTVIAEGARKLDTYPALTPAGLADLKAEVAALRDVFAESVAEGRRGRPDMAAVIATQSRAYAGPAALREALDIGLIDAILSADDALALWSAQFPGAAG